MKNGEGERRRRRRKKENEKRSRRATKWIVNLRNCEDEDFPFSTEKRRKLCEVMRCRKFVD